MGEFADETASGSDLESVQVETDGFAEPALEDGADQGDGVAVGQDAADIASAAGAGAPAAHVAEVGGLDPRQMLDTLRERPVGEHAEVYEDLHTHLQRTLAEIDGG